MLDDFVSKVEDADFLFTADVDDFAIGIFALSELDDRTHCVGNVSEASCLLAIAIDG